ncbi:MAG TPA: phosphoglucosamine mutase [Gemmatimonadota bacterium]|nr:phosphoglucosamine mutase [Gemmatimonadota bacterium]
MREGLVVSVSGIRGVVGRGLTPEVVVTFAAAHGAAARTRAGSNAIVLGRDARVSGPVFAAAAEAGLRAAGCDVLDVGLACTPTILLAVEDAGAAGGIAITASHNPAEWNALKLASHRGMFLTPEEGADVVAAAESGAIPWAAWDGLGELDPHPGATERHVERILADPLVDVDAVRARGFRVVLDACAGAGAIPTVPLLAELGVEVDGLHLEPTGRFPRDPEPTPANLAELAERVRATGAHLGLAIDPDGDRLALVDERGEVLGEDWTLALAVDYVLGERPGPVVTNLSTSQIVDRVAEAHGQEVRRTAVGEVNVALGMKAAESPIGGEGNGGVIYPAIHHTRDAPAGVALLLSHLARSGRALSEVVAGYPAYSIRKAKVSLERIDAATLLPRVEAAFEGAAVDRTDGLRFSWPESGRWLHVRQSGTEPVVRLIAEAPEAAEADALLDRVQELARTR